MAIYIYHCDRGHTIGSTVHGLMMCPEMHGGHLRRDYRAEGVSTMVGEAPRAARGDILPTAKDFERPEDPTGERGMRNWMEVHEPRPENKNPAWPTRSERQGI